MGLPLKEFFERVLSVSSVAQDFVLQNVLSVFAAFID